MVRSMLWMLAWCGLTGVALADDEVFSGPQAGETISGLNIRLALGDGEGAALDVVAQTAGKPLLVIFVHEITRPSIGLARIIADYAATRNVDGLHTAIVLLTSDPTATQTWVKNARHALPQNVWVGISTDGVEGPGAYGLHREMTLTILVAKDSKVTANFALLQPSVQADGPKILQAIVDVLGGGDVPKIEELARGGQMRREGRPAAGAAEELRALLRPVIQRDASDEQIDRAAKAVDGAIAKNKAIGVEISQIANRIIHAGKLSDYGTPRSQEHLKRWAEAVVPKNE